MKMNVKLVVIEVDTKVKGSTRFFNIESSSRFNTARVGYVLPKNDHLKVGHFNEDVSIQLANEAQKIIVQNLKKN